MLFIVSLIVQRYGDFLNPPNLFFIFTILLQFFFTAKAQHAHYQTLIKNKHYK